MAKKMKINKKVATKKTKPIAKAKVASKSKSSLKKVTKPKTTKTAAKPKITAKKRPTVKKKPVVKKEQAINTTIIVTDNTPKEIIPFTQDKLRSYLHQIFDKDIHEVEDRFLITEGSAIVQIVVRPWYEDDSVIEIFSFVVEGAEITPELTNFLLRKNATLHFGAFGLTFDNTVIFTCSLAGSNLDLNELKAALQTVATISDYYDDQIVAIAGGKRGIDVNNMAIEE